MTLGAEKLEKLRRAGDLAGIVDFFRGSTGADRRSFEQPMLAAERAARRTPEIAYDQWDRECWEASKLAVLACASWEKLQRINWEIGGPHFGDAEWSEWWRQALRLVEHINPAWTGSWAELLLRQNLDHWFFVRELVRRNLCATPATDRYTHGLMRAMRWRFHTYRRKKHGDGAESRFATIADALLDDPALLQHDVWRLFEVEGTSKCNLQALEPTQGTNWMAGTKIPADVEKSSWRYALVQLAAKGKLPRARLLEASLATLTRDFEPHHAGWFFRLHDELAPTTAERAARAEHYLKLIASPHPNISVWALQTVVALDKAQPIAAADLIAHLAPALAAKSKTGVKATLQLLGRAIAREPKPRSELLRLATDALTCEAADVQLLVFKLLEEYGDKSDQSLLESLRARAGSIVPTLRERAARWIGHERGGAKSAPKPGSSTRIAPIVRAVPRLDPSRLVTPIVTFDELLKRASFALAHPADIDEVECVLDGFARLSANRPSDYAARVAPLRRQIVAAGWPHLAKKTDLFADALLAKAEPALLMRVPALLGAVLETWCVDKVVLPSLTATDELNQTFRFLFQRLEGIALIVHQRASLPLLSAPTHRGGWIDPRGLVMRLRSWAEFGARVDSTDFSLALLRLAPEGREEALSGLKGLTSEAANALRHALGAKNIKVGKTAALWVAAARARAPFLDDVAVESAHPRLGPDAGCAGRLEWRTEKTSELFKNPMEAAMAEMIGVKPSPDRAFTLDTLTLIVSPGLPAKLGSSPLPVLLHGPWDGDGLSYRDEADFIRWAFTLWPASPEPVFGALALWLMAATQSFNYRQGYRHVFMEAAFEKLDAPDTHLGPMGSLLHALALLSPDPECRTLATRTLVALIDTQRFSAPALGTTLSRLLGTTTALAARLTPGLAEAAHVSPVHARAVRSLIEESLAGDPSKAPKDLSKLFGLLLELVTADGEALSHTDARDYLAKIPRSSPAAKFAARLLAGG